VAVTQARLRQLALALPEAAVEDHHGMDSFRVRGKIFATVPDRHHVRVMVDEAEILALVDEDPAIYEPVFWGKRLSCAAVDLRVVPVDRLAELLGEAWLRKAPAALARAWSETPRG
jgi:hypothetical protein